MGKSILVMDNQDSYHNCPLHYAYSSSVNRCRGKVINRSGGIPVYKALGVGNLYGSKPDWCPLKNLSKKNPSKLPPMADMPREYTDYEKGWNDCIKKILGG